MQENVRGLAGTGVSNSGRRCLQKCVRYAVFPLRLFRRLSSNNVRRITGYRSANVHVSLISSIIRPTDGDIFDEHFNDTDEKLAYSYVRTYVYAETGEVDESKGRSAVAKNRYSGPG